MAEVLINIEGGLALDGGSGAPLTPQERKRLTVLAETFSAELGPAATRLVDELIGDDDAVERPYILGALPGTEISTRQIHDPIKSAVLRLLSGFTSSPTGYGVEAFPEAFYAALYEALQDRELSWDYTATVVGYGDEYTLFNVTVSPNGLTGFCTTYAWDEAAGEYTAAEPGQSALSSIKEELEGGEDEEVQPAGTLVAEALEMSGCGFTSFGDNEIFEVETLPDGTEVKVDIALWASGDDSLIHIRHFNVASPPIPSRKSRAMALKICSLNETLRAGAFGLWKFDEGYSVGYREIIDLNPAPRDVVQLAKLLADAIRSSFRVFTEYEAKLWNNASPSP